jgi:hypothetical protein
MLSPALAGSRQKQSGVPRQPPAPPVYRPQPVPKVCQRKAVNSGAGSVNPKPNGKRPEVAVQRSQIKPPAPAHYGQRQSGTAKTPPAKNVGSINQRSNPNARTQQLRPQATAHQAPPQARVVQGKVNHRLARVPNAGQSIQLTPNYSDYTSWLDKQPIPMPLRGTLNNRLRLAQQAIAYTRQKLVHGAGNITAQVEKSKHYSYKYTREAYARENSLAKKLLKPEDDRSDILVKLVIAQAITARKTRAGNCDHFAAVSLFYLLEHAPQNTGRLFRLSVGGSGTGHSVVIYADEDWTPHVASDQNAYQTAVVVDAWPTYAFACAWADWKYRTDHPRIIFSLLPQSNGVARSRQLRPYRAELKPSTEYQELQQIKLQSTADHVDNQTKWFRSDFKHDLRYPAWTDEHPLYDEHPSDDCFITTACVEANGLSDNCSELNTLRAFRDGFMLGHSEGEKLIAEYYVIAPQILKRIREQPDAQAILVALYRPIQDCVLLINAGENEAALWHYVTMVENLKDTYSVTLRSKRRPQQACEACIGI